MDRYIVSAVITFNNEEDRRYRLGSAPSRRKARRLGYREGHPHYPLHSRAVFTLEIIDTETGETVRASGAETEAYHRARAMPTVADLGYW